MTHSGGKSHRVGDFGQRYEAWCTDGDDEEMHIGYSDSATGFKNMVDFYEVHGKAVAAAKGRIRSGEIWNVAVREPLPMPKSSGDATCDLMGIVVRFMAIPDGRLEPATPRDQHEISEWNARHKHTPRESFQLPAIWRS